MTKKIFTFASLLIVAAMILAACTSGGGSVPTEAPPAKTEEPVDTEEPMETEEPVDTEEPMETEEPVETEETMPELTGTITLWHALKETELESLTELLAAFQEMYPGVQMDVLYVPDTDLQGKYETASATGGGPTVIIGFADWGPAWYDSVLVADISGDFDPDLLSTVNPAALGALQYKGALIGVPDSIKGVLLFRNKSIVPEAAATWEELLANAVDNTEGDVQGAFFEGGPFFSMPHLEACGGKLMDENGDPAFNNEAGVCWMEDIFLAVQEAGIPGTINTDDDVNLFVAGKTGIIIDGLWNLGKFLEEVGEDNLVIDPWPDTPQGNLSGYVQTENLYLNANATGDDAEAGLTFMEFFLSPEAQAIMADPTKAAHLPSVQGVEISDPFFMQAVTAFEKGIPFPVIPEMGAYWGPIETLIRSVVDEGADPAEALASAEEAINAAIAEIRGE